MSNTDDEIQQDEFTESNQEIEAVLDIESNSTHLPPDVKRDSDLAMTIGDRFRYAIKQIEKMLSSGSWKSSSSAWTNHKQISVALEKRELQKSDQRKHISTDVK